MLKKSHLWQVQVHVNQNYCFGWDLSHLEVKKKKKGRKKEGKKKMTSLTPCSPAINT